MRIKGNLIELLFLLPVLSGCIVIGYEPPYPLIENYTYKGVVNLEKGVAEVAIHGSIYKAKIRERVGLRYKGFLQEIVTDDVEFIGPGAKKIVCPTDFHDDHASSRCKVDGLVAYSFVWFFSLRNFTLYGLIREKIDVDRGLIELNVEGVRYGGRFNKESEEEQPIMLKAETAEPLKCKIRVLNQKYWSSIECFGAGGKFNLYNSGHSFHI